MTPRAAATCVARQRTVHLELLWRDQQPEDTLAVGLRYQFYY